VFNASAWHYELCDVKLGRIPSAASLGTVVKGGDHMGEFDDPFVHLSW